jgi:hypothetical protein
MQAAKRNKNRINLFLGIRPLVIVPLLFLYAIGLQINSIHRFLHNEHENAVLHTIAAENDPCHRSIYHHEKEACKHRSHLHQSETCELCQISISTDQWIGLRTATLKQSVQRTVNTELLQSLQTICAAYLPSRAPPAL